MTAKEWTPPRSYGTGWRIHYAQVSEAIFSMLGIAKSWVTGKPFNIASYALFTHMVAQVCGLGVGDFVHSFGDVHLYSNHFEQAKLQLAREPRPLPTLVINPAVTQLEDFVFGDFEFIDYNPHPHIKAAVAV